MRLIQQFSDVTKEMVRIILCLASLMVTMWLPVAFRLPYFSIDNQHKGEPLQVPSTEELGSFFPRISCQHLSHLIAWKRTIPHPGTNQCHQDMLIGLSPPLKGEEFCFCPGRGAARKGGGCLNNCHTLSKNEDKWMLKDQNQQEVSD